MKDIGALGEELVVKWLKLQDCRLLKQNWRCRWGELDLIVRDNRDSTIIFVEVKTRCHNNWDENGLLAIDAVKQEKIVKTASLFLAECPQLAEYPCRFDVALVSYVRQKHQSSDARKINHSIELGVPVEIASYKLTIESYLQSAFEA